MLLQPHSLWYTSRHAPSSVPHHLLNPHDPTAGAAAGASSHPHDGHAQHPHPHPRDRDQRRALVERTALARLRHDEQVMERRRANVANYGSAWLKPPGVPKTLFQLREERRELEEQAEAHRREALLQAQLAEAEGGGGGGAGADALGMDMMLAGDEDDEPMGEDEDQEEQQDLDDDIPEGEGFGFDGEDSDEEEDDDDDEDEDEETVSITDGSRGEDDAGAVRVSPAEAEQVRDVRIRAAEDRLREMLARMQDGGPDAGDAFADEESREGLLEEDDLVPMQQHPPGGAPAASAADVSMGMDMDMDANLDEDIPEDDEGMYEHTDSDEDLSDDATRELSFAGRSSIGAGHASGGSRLRRSAHGSVRRASLRGRDRGSLAQSDMDISGLLSNNDSSFLGDSPYMRRGV